MIERRRPYINLNATLREYNPALEEQVRRDPGPMHALRRVAHFYGQDLPLGPDYGSVEWMDFCVELLHEHIVSLPKNDLGLPHWAPRISLMPGVTREEYIAKEMASGRTCAELAGLLALSRERVSHIHAQWKAKNARKLHLWRHRPVESRPIDMGGIRDQWVTFTAEDQWREFSNKTCSDHSELSAQLGTFGVTRFEADHGSTAAEQG